MALSIPLEELPEEADITDLLDDEKLAEIGNMVVDEFDRDKQSRKEWETRYEHAMKLATQVSENKTYPWPKAANVQYPALTMASIQFHAKAYPALVPSGDIVTGKVTGRDPNGEKRMRSERLGMHMSYQIFEEMENWEEEMDKLLLYIPIVGCAFKKTYFDPDKEHNVSEMVPAGDLVVDYHAKNINEASRLTHILEYSKNKLFEQQRLGLFRSVDLGSPVARDDIITKVKDEAQGMQQPDKHMGNEPHMILEQHCYLDLDEDGYSEPYIVYVDHNSREVLRIVARWTDEESIIYNNQNELVKIIPEEYFTKFSFIPSPDGGIYDMGFGTLLGPINHVINTLINQLVDAGTLSNLQSGFISKQLRMRKGDMSFSPGEWKTVNASGRSLDEGIYPLPVREPSLVLFQLLGMLIQAGERLTSTTDMMVGENPGQNQKATTTMAVIEQGMKVFTAIYKRIRRSLGEEFKKLYKLNTIYLDESIQFSITNLSTKEQQMVDLNRDDYERGDIGVIPSADPNMANQQQRVQQAAEIVNMIPLGGIDPYEAKRRLFTAMDIPDIDSILPDPSTLPAEPPDPELLKAQHEIELGNARFRLELAEYQQRAEKEGNDTMIKAYEAETKRLAVEGKVLTDSAKVSADARKEGREKAAGDKSEK